jgi:hypothetical protein
MSGEWNLLEAYVVTIPSVNTTTGELGPPARLVVATEARAKEICSGHESRSYARATEANLTAQEIAGLRRAAAEKAISASP